MRRFFLVRLLLTITLTALPFSPPLASAQRAHSTTITTVAPAASVLTLAATAREAAESITSEQLKEDLYFISSDEMAGRDTPSLGLDATAKFIAARLASLKLKPAGDSGTYFQKIDLRSVKVNATTSTAEFGNRTFKYGADFLTGTINGTASGALVYAGHGYRIKSKKIDAYHGLNVRNKIIVVASGVYPPGVARAELKGPAGADDWDDAASYARKHGAKGLILIPRSFERAWRWGLRRANIDYFQPARFIERDEDEGRSLPTIIPSEAMLKQIFEGETRSGEDILKKITAREPGAAFAFNPQKKISFTVNTNVRTGTTQNVIAVLEGSDPVLKNEYVAVGAHYDHVGTGTPDKTGDRIYNGADDDGSGTTAVLAIAKAFATGGLPRPKRSILFVWHAGEEKGLWGSEYFAEYPTVPLDKIVAQLNIDMIGRSKQPNDTNQANKELTGPHEIYVIGSKEMSTQLGELSERVNRSYLNLNFNYLYDDPADPNRFFYRSDHFNYAKKGIPIIFYFDGVHEDYHRPSDTADKIDYQKMQKVTRTVFMTAAELANLPARPVVDKPLSAERLEM